MAEGDIRLSSVSRPFVVVAVILVFAGSITGSVWMMYLLGADVAIPRGAFQLHRVFQVDGFLTLLVMGVGYMIVPRFRNLQLPSARLAYFSFFLVVFSIAASIVSASGMDIAAAGIFARVAGVSIFAAIVLWTLRIHPKLLRTADYFIALAVLTLFAINVMHLLDHARSGGSLSEVQILLLFPILMIFGVQYKTMPSFLGFIRPRKRLSVIAVGLAVASVILGFLSTLQGGPELAIAFNAALLGCGAAFAGSVYTFGGFDNSEILRLIQGEKKASYMYTVRHSRLAFLLLFAGIAIALGFNASSSFILYDLAIHYTAIGFIGITIALYLPLMLPPITGKTVHFTKFSGLPVLLVVAALASAPRATLQLPFRRAMALHSR